MPKQDDILERLTALYDLKAEYQEQNKSAEVVTDLIERLEEHRKPFK